MGKDLAGDAADEGGAKGANGCAHGSFSQEMPPAAVCFQIQSALSIDVRLNRNQVRAVPKATAARAAPTATSARTCRLLRCIPGLRGTSFLVRIQLPVLWEDCTGLHGPCTTLQAEVDAECQHQ